jgi:hypothetical protein
MNEVLLFMDGMGGVLPYQLAGNGVLHRNRFWLAGSQVSLQEQLLPQRVTL